MQCCLFSEWEAWLESSLNVYDSFDVFSQLSFATEVRSFPFHFYRHASLKLDLIRDWKTTAEEHSFEWSYFRISSSDSKLSNHLVQHNKQHHTIVLLTSLYRLNSHNVGSISSTGSKS